jgi:membrane protease YdiL (CAAX protease family)
MTSLLAVLAFAVPTLAMLAMASSRVIGSLRRFYDNPLHGLLPALMLLIPYLMVTLPGASQNRAEFGLGLLKILIFILIPSLALLFKPRPAAAFDLFDMVALFGIWLPIELKWLPEANAIIGGADVPIPQLIGILLGFYLFLVIRPLEMGYTFSLTRHDFLTAIQAWAAFAVTGIPLGLAIHFLDIRLAEFNAIEWILRLLIIYFLNALPEEMLFRGVLQNLLEMRFGKTWLTLLIPAVIFGLAHINNGTTNYPVPNFGFVLMATIAGLAYGWTWRKTGKITGAALTHTFVNFMWIILLEA